MVIRSFLHVADTAIKGGRRQPGPGKLRQDGDDPTSHVGWQSHFFLQEIRG